MTFAAPVAFTRYPVVNHAVRLLVKWRALVITVIAVLYCFPNQQLGDWLPLSTWASQLVGSSGLHVYAQNPKLQAGPVALLAIRAFNLWGMSTGARIGNVVMTLAGAGLLLAAERQVIRSGRCPSAERAQLVTVLLAVPVLQVWQNLAGYYLHLDDVMALAAVAAAVTALQSGRPYLAAVASGLAGGCQPWAIFAFPVLIGGCRTMPEPASRRVNGPVTLALVVLAGCWLPFILADRGTLDAGRVVVPIAFDAPLRALGLVNSPTWQRPVQLLAILFCASLALRRGDWLLSPAAGLLARLLLERNTYPYYTATALVCVVAVDLSRRGVAWRTVTLWAGLFLDEFVLSQSLCAWIRLVVLVGLLAELLFPGLLRRRGGRPAETTTAVGTAADAPALVAAP